MSILQGLYPLVPHWSHWGAHSTPFHFTSKSCKMQNFFSSWVMSWLQIYMNLLFYTVVPFQKGHNKPVQVMLHLCCFLYMKSHGFMSYFTFFFFFRNNYWNITENHQNFSPTFWGKTHYITKNSVNYVQVYS